MSSNHDHLQQTDTEARFGFKKEEQSAFRAEQGELTEVTIQLGGACSGCGISPMTIQAIKSRMVKEIPEIEQVEATTGMDGGGGGKASPSHGGGMSPSFPGETTDDDGPEAPF